MQAYVFDAALLCEECGTEAIQDLTEDRSVPPERPVDKQDSDEWPQGPFGEGGGEADCPQHCASCGVFLENPLTDKGHDYVREQYARARDETDLTSCGSIGVTQMWANHYACLELPGEGNCCICTKDILPSIGSTWTGGHNAEPVAPGRCCNVCNSTVVVPERIRGLRHPLQRAT
jgi:hypothetical protein